MESNLIHIKGKIEFDATDLTKKHQSQSEWKRVALISIPGEYCQYYSWFIKKRYGISLNKPIRNAHITFINDRFSDVKGDSDGDKEILWNDIKKKYENKWIDVTLNLDVRSDANHWWMNIPEDYRKELHGIRAELGLGRPYWGLHMTVGSATHLELEQSKYIHRLIEKKLING